MSYNPLDKPQLYIAAFCSQNIGEYSICHCHTPAGATDTEHTCQVMCFSRYPLQTDSSICSVAILLMAGLAFADKSYFYKNCCVMKSLQQHQSRQHFNI